MSTEFRVSVGARLREERLRLDLGGQEQAGALSNTSKRTYQDWERGVSTVSAEHLATAVAHGADVLYILTGHRASAAIELDPMRRALLDCFDRCSPEKQIEAVQYMALLAAGVAPGKSGATGSTTTAKVSKSIFGIAVGNVVGKKK